jgi:hypothetical protein
MAINPNKLLFIAVITAMLSCSSTDTQTELPVKKENSILAVTIPELEDLNEINGDGAVLEPASDTSLSLYRHSETHNLVVDFYCGVTGSDRISMPIIYHADKNDISLSLAFSLAWVESRFSPTAFNKNYSSIDRGLFQLNNRSFPKLSVRDFFDPEINARNGLKYLRYCIDAGGSEIIGLAMYNAGRSRVTSSGAPHSTLVYISRIMSFRNKLESEFKDYVRDKLHANGTFF